MNLSSLLVRLSIGVSIKDISEGEIEISIGEIEISTGEIETRRNI